MSKSLDRRNFIWIKEVREELINYFCLPHGRPRWTSFLYFLGHFTFVCFLTSADFFAFCMKGQGILHFLLHLLHLLLGTFYFFKLFGLENIWTLILLFCPTFPKPDTSQISWVFQLFRRFSERFKFSKKIYSQNLDSFYFYCGRHL